MNQRKANTLFKWKRLLEKDNSHLVKENSRLETEERLLRSKIEVLRDERDSLMCKQNADAQILSEFRAISTFLIFCLAGIPRRYNFKPRISDTGDLDYLGDLKYDVISMALELSGIYELHGFGRYDGDLKMAKGLDGPHGLTPVWLKANADSQFVIFFNRRSEEWELREKICCSNGFSFTHPRLVCKTGLFRHF